MPEYNLHEWIEDFEKSNPLYVIEIVPYERLKVYRKSIMGPRVVGIFDTPDEFCSYIQQKPSC